MRQVFCIRARPKTNHFSIEMKFLKQIRVGINNGETNYYWVEKDGKKIKDRFFRQELFALKGQFEELKMDVSCIYFYELELNDENQFYLDF